MHCVAEDDEASQILLYSRTDTDAWGIIFPLHSMVYFCFLPRQRTLLTGSRVSGPRSADPGCPSPGCGS